MPQDASTPAAVAADLGRVQCEGGFWGHRQRVNRERTLPSQHRHLTETGRLAALDPRHRPGDRSARHIFWDSDTAKWLEAAAYSLATHPDAELEGQVEAVVAALGRLQSADGYLNSWFQNVEPEKRWTNLRDWHELYCAGHLMEAAVAHHRATARRDFLDIMGRYADHIGAVFGTGPGQKRGYPGHEEIELALVKLHRATGEARYLDLARYFVDERGRQPHYYHQEAEAGGEQPQAYVFGDTYAYSQAHVPVRQQDRAVGHAVRAMYLYAGMTDLLAGSGDPELAAALEKLWANVTLRRMYVTGGVGSSHQGERFTDDYDLPEETAYCETCAAIGLVFWAHRLANHYGDARYADVMELALHNGALSGVALDGEHYFYVNPLASTGAHHRQAWFGCACCPPNLARLIASLGQYTYSEGAEGWIHLYAAGAAELDIGGVRTRLEVQTEYPWDGRVAITVTPERETELALNLRLPAWCREPSASVTGQPVAVSRATRHGYLHLQRTWRPGDTATPELPMPVDRVRAHPAVRMASGKVALRRGPVVYCLEGVDNRLVPLARLSLPRGATLRARHHPEMLGGVTTIEGSGPALTDRGWEGHLYGPGAALAASEPFRFRAVPYCVWDNREPGPMAVWLREAD
ncbi:MAG: beta-L-arabinofuranosidase domain-containing protein [Gemmatimonadota bacterium]